jgi:glyoxylase-like metal-dependent hydrolase (beta-lactamase superfamily II)
LSTRHAIPVEGPHPGDLFWIEGLDQQSRMFGFPPVESFTPDRWLNDGEVVTVGSQQLQVLHCPGHTPGHVVFYHQASELALVGDVLFQGSIGRTDFPQGNHQQLIDSIRNKLLPLGDDVAFIPGHGPMSTFGEERRHNPFVSDKRYG